jgi:hypothetical protein
MGNTFAGGIQVVLVTNRGERRYWAAAVSRERAVEAVLEIAPPGSTGTLTDRHLTPEQAAELKLRPNGVRELKYAL